MIAPVSNEAQDPEAVEWEETQEIPEEEMYANDGEGQLIKLPTVPVPKDQEARNLGVLNIRTHPNCRHIASLLYGWLSLVKINPQNTEQLSEILFCEQEFKFTMVYFWDGLLVGIAHDPATVGTMNDISSTTNYLVGYSIHQSTANSLGNRSISKPKTDVASMSSIDPAKAGGPTSVQIQSRSELPETSIKPKRIQRTIVQRSVQPTPGQHLAFIYPDLSGIVGSRTWREFVWKNDFTKLKWVDPEHPNCMRLAIFGYSPKLKNDFDGKQVTTPYDVFPDLDKLMSSISDKDKTVPVEMRLFISAGWFALVMGTQEQVTIGAFGAEKVSQRVAAQPHLLTIKDNPLMSPPEPYKLKSVDMMDNGRMLFEFEASESDILEKKIPKFMSKIFEVYVVCSQPSSSVDSGASTTSTYLGLEPPSSLSLRFKEINSHSSNGSTKAIGSTSWAVHDHKKGIYEILDLTRVSDEGKQPLCRELVLGLPEEGILKICHNGDIIGTKSKSCLAWYIYSAEAKAYQRAYTMPLNNQDSQLNIGRTVWVSENLEYILKANNERGNKLTYMPLSLDWHNCTVPFRLRHSKRVWRLDIPPAMGLPGLPGDEPGEGGDRRSRHILVGDCLRREDPFFEVSFVSARDASQTAGGADADPDPADGLRSLTATKQNPSGKSPESPQSRTSRPGNMQSTVMPKPVTEDRHLLSFVGRDRLELAKSAGTQSPGRVEPGPLSSVKTDGHQPDVVCERRVYLVPSYMKMGPQDLRVEPLPHLGPTALLLAPSRLGMGMFNFDSITLFDAKTGVFDRLLLKQVLPDTLPASDESRFDFRDASLLGSALLVTCTQIVPFGPDDDPETYMGFNNGVEWAVYLLVDLKSRQTVKTWRTKITEAQEFKLQVVSGLLVEETNQPSSLTVYVAGADHQLKKVLVLPGLTYKPTLGLLRVEQRGLTLVSEGGKTSFFSDTPLLEGEAIDLSPSHVPDDKLMRKATSIADGAGLWNNRYSAYRFKLRRRIDAFLRGSVSPDGAYVHLVHGYTNSVVKTATFEMVTLSTSDMTYIESVFSDDNRWLFIPDNKATVLVFDLVLGQIRHRHRFPDGVHSLASLNASHLVTVKKFFHEKSSTAYGRVDIQRTAFGRNGDRDAEAYRCIVQSLQHRHNSAQSEVSKQEVLTELKTLIGAVSPRLLVQLQVFLRVVVRLELTEIFEYFCSRIGLDSLINETPFLETVLVHPNNQVVEAFLRLLEKHSVEHGDYPRLLRPDFVNKLLSCENPSKLMSNLLAYPLAGFNLKKELHNEFSMVVEFEHKPNCYEEGLFNETVERHADRLSLPSSTSSEPYMPFISLVPVDLRSGSFQSRKLMALIAGSSDEELIYRLRCLVYYKWSHTQTLATCYVLVYWTTCILSYIFYSPGYRGDSPALGIAVLVLLGVLLLFEVKCAITLGKSYFRRSSNIFDIATMASNFAVTIVMLVDSELGSATESTWNAVLLNWGLLVAGLLICLRGVTWFRVFRATRYLITMVMQVFIDFVPFLLLFACVVAIFGYVWRSTGFLGEIEFSEPISFYQSCYDSVMIIFGNSPDPERIDSTVRFLVVILGNIVLALVMANFLIAIISGTFERINDSKELYDVRELIGLIEDFDTFMAGFEFNSKQGLKKVGRVYPRLRIAAIRLSIISTWYRGMMLKEYFQLLQRIKRIIWERRLTNFLSRCHQSK